MDIITMIITFAALCSLLWLGYAIWKRFWPDSAANTTAGKTVGRIVDKSQDWSAMAALRAIRWMDEVENNAAALAAWEILYAAIGGTPYSPDEIMKPATTSVIPAASAPHIPPAAQTLPATPAPHPDGGVEVVVFDSAGKAIRPTTGV